MKRANITIKESVLERLKDAAVRERRSVSSLAGILIEQQLGLMDSDNDIISRFIKSKREKTQEEGVSDV
ncbi:MAG: hypothetical protein AAF984_07045 [Verrucomicrobiota bacterium]